MKQECEIIQISRDALASLRHALLTPLSAIIGYSEMVLGDAEEQQITQVIPDLQNIHAAAHLLLQIIGTNLQPQNLGNIPVSGTFQPLSSVSSIPVETLSEEQRVEQGFLLVVDDNAENCNVLRRYLERQGHRVMIAEHGRQALAMIEAHAFDMILLDILMPEMNGFQVLKRLKEEERLSRLPVLMISAVDEMAKVAQCIELGAEDFLTKPFNPILLRARINASLEKKRLRDQEVEYHRQLAETNEQLRIANRNYMQMLGFVTHELKSPLAAMQSLISIVLGGFTGGVSEKTRHYLTRISRNCEELQDMVKNYLDLSRAERGELVANKTSIDFIKEVVTPSVDQTRALFDSRHEKLTVTVPETLLVESDPELMRIALTNYLTNAAKYGAENTEAALRVNQDPDWVTICVRNQGAGFRPEDKASLFNKFSRLRNENTANKRGSGLGLFLVKYILELHGGTVWAESEAGQWAEFCFRFPVQ